MRNIFLCAKLHIKDEVFYNLDNEEFVCTGFNINIKPGNIVSINDYWTEIVTYEEEIYELADSRKASYVEIQGIVTFNTKLFKENYWDV